MLFTAGKIEEIEADESAFCTFISQYTEAALSGARLFPKLSRLRLVEVHGAWKRDMERVGAHEKRLEDGLDHFKRSGHLAFWVRRFTPVVEASDTMLNLGDSEGYPLDQNEQAFRDLLFGYTNEYLAFDLGFQFSRFYEINREDATARAPLVRPSVEYIATMCHFLKYKTVSPHAMTMIYKSLFLA